MTTEINKERDIDTIKMELEETLAQPVPIYQISKSQEIKNNIFVLLQKINQESHSYVLEIKNYIRNNVKDASSLKKAIIEKIHANLGD